MKSTICHHTIVHTPYYPTKLQETQEAQSPIHVGGGIGEVYYVNKKNRAIGVRQNDPVPYYSALRLLVDLVF